MFTFDFLPTSLLLFAFISSLFALIAFILALINFCVEVAVVSSLSAFATLGYQFSLVILAYREHQQRRADAIFFTRSARRRAGPTHRYYTMAGIIWGLWLCAMWIISFGVNTQVTVNGMSSIRLEDRNNDWNLGIQVAVSCFAGFEALVVGAMCIHNMLARKKAPVVDKETPTIEKSVSRTSSDRKSIASSRFSIDSIDAIPRARTKVGMKQLALLRGKVSRPVFNLAKYRP
ncbi:hypothetical protein VNI00_016300 [Paramarasmius palmivorus]|uniref:Uncharacterized protein n=1 Tax=Paramarasmius palmivorus TaxID=297713 RepID=A0AAW0BEQ9_9AGAR